MKTLFSILFLLLFMGQAEAVDVGEIAPDFSLNSLEGSSVLLSDYAGKVVYIFWFGNN